MAKKKDNILSGIVVVDFSWVVSGPVVTKFLGDYGAKIVKIESQTRPDLCRTNAPYVGGKSGLNRSGYFAFHNNNKLSLSLNMKNPKGREIVQRLVKKADVVVENYTPGTMDRWGLGYEALKKIKPDIIMLSMSMLGQTGPHANHLGYGHELQGYCGFTRITGWPDREVVQPFGALTDYLSPAMGAAAVLAALEERDRTGEGAHLDVSQAEAGIYALAPVMLDYFANGRTDMQRGNADDACAPHGAYCCQGDDRWSVIAVTSDAEWKAFCKTIGSPAWAKDSKFKTVLGRKENEAELDRLVEAWTVNQPAEQVMDSLQKAGVAASVVKNARDMIDDPQLAYRKYFKTPEHPEMGPFPNLGPCCLLSDADAEESPAPNLGQHTDYVCHEILGMSDEEFLEFFSAGAFE
ncbi:MAG: CoA transferase [Dehalococcoidales bacterium]|nr:CoA transferase [Dehalococcoidales bacterium]